MAFYTVIGVPDRRILMENMLDSARIWLVAYSTKVLAAILVFIVGKWISRKIASLVGRIITRNNVDVTLIPFFESLTYYSLLVLVVIAAASQLGINTTSFLTIVGAAGLAIGLALKDSLSNFASGVMLILFRPFKVGDVVSAGGVTGKVVAISIFNTILFTPDNQKIIVPNSKITADVITNVTANDTRRIDLVIGIGYDDDIDAARQILSRLIAEDKRILPEPEAVIALSELADSSVNFVVRPWVKGSDYWDVRFDLTEKIKKAFDEANIGIPYPQQDVHLYVEKYTPAA